MAGLTDTDDKYRPADSLPLDALVAGALEDAARCPRPGAWTGFGDLDGLTGGLRPGALWVVTGRSGAGKTVLATNLARSAAISQGLPTLCVVPPGAAGALAQRVLAAEGRVPLHGLRHGGLGAEDMLRLQRTGNLVAAAPFSVAEARRADAQVLRRHLAAAEAPVRLAVVDGLPQAAVGPADLDAFKDLARECGVCVVVVAEQDLDAPDAQLRRFEQRADVVLTVHRDDQGDPCSSRAGEADLIVSRNRAGPVATVVVAFQGHYGRFAELGGPAGH